MNKPLFLYFPVISFLLLLCSCFRASCNDSWLATSSWVSSISLSQLFHFHIQTTLKFYLLIISLAITSCYFKNESLIFEFHSSALYSSNHASMLFWAVKQITTTFLASYFIFCWFRYYKWYPKTLAFQKLSSQHVPWLIF